MIKNKDFQIICIQTEKKPYEPPPEALQSFAEHIYPTILEYLQKNQNPK